MESQRTDDPHVLTLYQAFMEHWKHTDQIRQLLLYNFLMGGTILVLGWTALYAAPRSAWSAVLLGVLSGAGLLLSALWLHIADRATAYYDMYERAAHELEERFSEPGRWPFHYR